MKIRSLAFDHLSFPSFFSEQNGCPLLQKGNRAVLCVPKFHFWIRICAGFGNPPMRGCNHAFPTVAIGLFEQKVWGEQKRIVWAHWTDSQCGEHDWPSSSEEKTDCAAFPRYFEILYFFRNMPFFEIKVENLNRPSYFQHFEILFLRK